MHNNLNFELMKTTSFFLLAFILTACGSLKFMQPYNTVYVNTNIEETNQKVSLTDLTGNSFSEDVKEGKFMISNSKFDYKFFSNDFTKKKRTLILSHPNYYPDTIVVNRTLRPLVFGLDLIGSAFVVGLPSAIIDFTNGNIWKVRRKSKNIDLTLSPKQQYFEKKIDSLITQFIDKNTARIDKAIILERIYSDYKLYKQEPYFSKSSEAMNKIVPLYLNILIEERNQEEIKSWLNKIESPFLLLFKEAEKKCSVEIEKDLEAKNQRLLDILSNPKNTQFNTTELNIIDSIYQLKQKSSMITTDAKVISQGGKFLQFYISGSYVEFLKYKNSTRSDFKDKYNQIKQTIRFISNDLKLNLNTESVMIQKLDSVYKQCIGFRSFCRYSDALSGKEYKEVSGGLSKEVYDYWYKTWVKPEYADNPIYYKSRTKFGSEQATITYTFPNWVFKDEKRICVEKQDFPDESGTRLEDGKVKNIKRNHIYYKYYVVRITNNDSYANNMRIANENEERTKEILAEGKTTINTELKLNRELQVTGSLHERAMSFSPATGPLTDKNIIRDDELKWENAVYDERGELSIYNSMLSALQFELSTCYDYGEGFKLFGVEFESLFENQGCSPDAGGVY